MSDPKRAVFFEKGPWEAGDACPAELEIEGWKITCHPDPIQEVEDTFEGFTCASVFIGSEVTDGQLDRFPDLELITTRSTGYDHIDLDACDARDITVCNVAAYAENTVAEHTFGLILALSRKIFKAYQRTRNGDLRLEGLRGFDLHGKTLGVVGAGAIGLHVIRIGRALGMQCVAYDIRQDELISDVLDFQYVELDQLLTEADVVSLHVPLVPETRHIIDTEALKKMNSSALLINTARGELVDTGALVQALDNDEIAGAGLDVFEGEVLVGEEDLLLRREASREQLEAVIETQALLKRDNVVATPHIGFYSEEAIQRIEDTTVANIVSFSEGEPQNVVN